MKAEQAKALVIKGLLRRQFMERERILADLKALDIEIDTNVKSLASIERVPFLRIERVRQQVMGEEVLEAAE